MLRLWEQGLIDLDETITSYLPPGFMTTLKGDGYRPEAMTVRHLLTHTSGLFDTLQKGILELVKGHLRTGIVSELE